MRAQPVIANFIAVAEVPIVWTIFIAEALDAIVIGLVAELTETAWIAAADAAGWG